VLLLKSHRAFLRLKQEKLVKAEGTKGEANSRKRSFSLGRRLFATAGMLTEGRCPRQPLQDVAAAVPVWQRHCSGLPL